MMSRPYGIDQLRESMVKVLGSDGQTPSGSGFMIRPDGYLITCHHVIYQLDNLRVEYQSRRYEARWCEDLSDPEVDIAILKLEIEGARAVPIINPPDLSTSVTVCGFPPARGGYFPEGFDVSAQHIRRSVPIRTVSTYRMGQISSTNPWNKLPQDSSTFHSHRLDAKVDSGTSGGPVLAEALEGVVGVVQCSRSDESYVIRWDNIKASLDRLGLEPEKNAVCQFLDDIADTCKYIRLLHTPQPIVLREQYIPIQITLERQYTHQVETTWSYAESEAELKRAYALKGQEEESKQDKVDWEAAKKQHPQIMVLADPGMGKSTLLRMEAGITAQTERQKLSENQKTIDDVIFPLFLRLSELLKREAEVIDAIPILLKRDYPKTFSGIEHLLTEKLSQGKCLLLLDALDEVPKAQRNHLAKKLNRFARHYPCLIICTSRIVGYGGAFVDGAKEVEIVPFSPKQTQQYIQTWFVNAADHIDDDSVSAKALIRELQHKPQIGGLAQNPLLLSLLCSLYQEKGLTLPARRTQVYQKAVDYMLSKWSCNRQPASEGKIRAKIRLLEELAYQFTCEGKEIFSLDELYDKIEEYLKGNQVSTVFRNSNSDELITELAEEDGILQKLARGGDQYLFLHRTFQEYLTAAYLNRAIEKNQGSGINLAKEHFWDYDWHETLSLLAGLMKDPIPLLKAITNEKDDIFSSLLLLAGRCLAECQDGSHPLSTEIINQIYDLWLDDRFHSFTTSTLVALGQGHSQVSERLQKILQDEDDYVRGIAAEALGQIGSSEVVRPLISALQDESSFVRGTAAEALGRIGNPEVVRPLISALYNDEDHVVRGTAAEALGQISSPEVVRPLISALLEDSDVREAAAGALGQIGSLEVVKLLISALQDENPFIREIAAETLGQIGSPEVVRLLISALQDNKHDVRREAAETLGRIDSPEVVRPLISALQDESSFVRGTAAEALGRIGNPEVVRPLISALYNDEDYAVRWTAAGALGRIGSSEAVRTLISAVQDKDFYVRRTAVEALGQIDSLEVVRLLTSAVQDKDFYVRRIAAKALGRIGSSKVVRPLSSTLQDKDFHVKREAVETLGQIGSLEAVRLLTSALQDEDDSIRRIAAKALGQIGTSETLVTLIQSPDIDIYDQAIFRLARTLAVRYSKEGVSFIPVYLELVRQRAT